MKTISVTTARQNLGHWLKLAAQGEEIGVMVGADIIALRKVPVQSADYARQEYGLDRTQVVYAEQWMDAHIKRETGAGTVKKFTGDWRELSE